MLVIKNSMERLRDKTEPFPMNTRIYTFHPQMMPIYLIGYKLFKFRKLNFQEYRSVGVTLRLGV